MLLFNLRAKSEGRRGRGFSLLASLIPFLFFLSSCGFSPVYSQKGDNVEIAAKLASVDVKQIKTILGQQYVNALEDVLDPAHAGAVKEYIIEAALTKDVQALAIERDRTVTRFKVIIVVDYKIKEISSGRVISEGAIKNEADYDRVNSDYATYVSENETASRAIRELAQDTKIRVISALLK